ncbi:hypothetical protein [Thioclava sp. GXIMD2076]|uniref:Uncharacterized protein n=1 Tax=Thioclava kandeliae TaxID=3070818 RepID=A0ABV1SDE7_9RHOB
MNQIVKFPEQAESALKQEDALAYYNPGTHKPEQASPQAQKPANIAVLDEMYGYYSA